MNNEEIMETANNIVFRPLFTYRKQTAQKKRIVTYNNNNVRRNSNIKRYHINSNERRYPLVIFIYPNHDPYVNYYFDYPYRYSQQGYSTSYPYKYPTYGSQYPDYYRNAEFAHVA